MDRVHTESRLVTRGHIDLLRVASAACPGLLFFRR
ncbi:putative leader peptide [Frankia sp. CiP1_Cm_nod1]